MCILNPDGQTDEPEKRVKKNDAAFGLIIKSKKQ
jgi:hypothetical protein